MRDRAVPSPCAPPECRFIHTPRAPPPEEAASALFTLGMTNCAATSAKAASRPSPASPACMYMPPGQALTIASHLSFTRSFTSSPITKSVHGEPAMAFCASSILFFESRSAPSVSATRYELLDLGCGRGEHAARRQ